MKEYNQKYDNVHDFALYLLLDKAKITEKTVPLGKLVRPSCVYTDSHDIKAQIYSKVTRLN
jgi:hypothetical protein